MECSNVNFLWNLDMLKCPSCASVPSIKIVSLCVTSSSAIWLFQIPTHLDCSFNCSLDFFLLIDYASDDHIENFKKWETMFGFLLSDIASEEVCVFVNNSSSWAPCLLSYGGIIPLSHWAWGNCNRRDFFVFLYDKCTYLYQNTNLHNLEGVISL
jgi:hypothetical protein